MKILRLLFSRKPNYLPPPDRSVMREIEIADILSRRFNSGKFKRRMSNGFGQQ